MARSYRKVAAAADKLRRTLGMLTADNVTVGDNPFLVIGHTRALVSMALEDLMGVENTEDYHAYLDGRETVARWSQPELPIEA